MSRREIEKANITKANATRDSVYTIHKYALINTSNTFQQQQACKTDKYENAHTQAVTIEFWRSQEHSRQKRAAVSGNSVSIV